jgi:hypothetical protein
VDWQDVRLSDTGSAVAGGVVAKHPWPVKKTISGEPLAAGRLVLGIVEIGHVEQGQDVVEVVR